MKYNKFTFKSDTKTSVTFCVKSQTLTRIGMGVHILLELTNTEFHEYLFNRSRIVMCG